MSAVLNAPLIYKSQLRQHSQHKLRIQYSPSKETNHTNNCINRPLLSRLQSTRPTTRYQVLGTVVVTWNLAGSYYTGTQGYIILHNYIMTLPDTYVTTPRATGPLQLLDGFGGGEVQSCLIGRCLAPEAETSASDYQVPFVVDAVLA